MDVNISFTGGDLIKCAALLAAGIAVGFGAIGSGAGEGFAAGKACEAVSKRPDLAPLITRTMVIGQAVAESVGIYGLVVGLLLIFMFAR